MNQVKRKVHYWCADTIEGKCKGERVVAAVLDTGIAPHPDFKGRILAFQDCVRGRRGIYDDSGHGTHVAGILAGNGRMSGGRYAGIAPGADLCVVKILDEKGGGDLRHILEGIRWVKRHARRLGIRVVNLSVGAKSDIGKDKKGWLVGAVEQLWDIGLVVVVSAGNYGPAKGTVAVPGTSRKVITVGAEAQGRRAGCSGMGPTEECVVKPDVVAPGYQVISCCPVPGNRERYYTAKSGASMATPAVSGAVALLLSKYPELSNVGVKMRLRETCRAVPGAEGMGWGLLRVDRLLAEA